MPRVSVVVGDITRLHEQGLRPDVVVNAANEGLVAGSGVCGAIFAAAGHRELAEACRSLGGCPTGSAVATPAFGLAPHGVHHIVHAVGPVWREGHEAASDALLADTYRAVLNVASQVGARRVAVPAISTGIYGFPEVRAASIAARTVLEDDSSLDDVWLVAFDTHTATVLGDALTAERARHGPGPCQSCGLPQARTWATPDGQAHLCPPCAALHGLGCP